MQADSIHILVINYQNRYLYINNFSFKFLISVKPEFYHV